MTWVVLMIRPNSGLRADRGCFYTYPDSRSSDLEPKGVFPRPLFNIASDKTNEVHDGGHIHNESLNRMTGDTHGLEYAAKFII